MKVPKHLKGRRRKKEKALVHHKAKERWELKKRAKEKDQEFYPQKVDTPPPPIPTEPKSIVIDLIRRSESSARHKDWCRIQDDVCHIQVPEQFSFIENTESSLGAIHAIAEAVSRRDITKYIIDHQPCAFIDLDASIVMDAIVLEAERVWKKRRNDVNITGYHSPDAEVRELIRTCGITKHLQVPGQEPLPEEKERHHNFPLCEGSKEISRAGKSSKAERVNTRLAEYFDSCLSRIGFGLTKDGLRALTQLVGEVMDNAVEHSGKTKWYAIGYMRQKFHQGQCHIVLFNIGKTIYESLKYDCRDNRLISELSDLTRMHKGVFSLRWSEENLWTLYSLQDGVTRYDRTDEENVGRGLGTIKLIEFFQSLGRTSKSVEKQPRMCIISGMTQIIFDGRYMLREADFKGGRRQIIAFNEKNDLHKQPDPRYVRNLKTHFPGTIISLRFYLDKTYLSKVSKN